MHSTFGLIYPQLPFGLHIQLHLSLPPVIYSGLLLAVYLSLCAHYCYLVTHPFFYYVDSLTHYLLWFSYASITLCLPTLPSIWGLRTLNLLLYLHILSLVLALFIMRCPVYATIF